MSDTNSIKVQIANRSYPIKVNTGQEAAVRQAVQLVNERVRENETLYAVKDPQDLLAMCALQLASEQLGVHLINQDQIQEIHKELDTLSELVGKFSVNS